MTGPGGTNVPQQQNPGLILQREDFRDRIPVEKPQIQIPADADEALDEVELNVPETAEPADAQGQVRIPVNRIYVEGSTEFTPEALASITSKYEGQTLSLSELGQAVQEINALYREKGYLTSQAYLPPQDIQNGQVTIQVIEGSIGKVQIAGNKYLRSFAVVITPLKSGIVTRASFFTNFAL